MHPIEEKEEGNKRINEEIKKKDIKKIGAKGTKCEFTIFVMDKTKQKNKKKQKNEQKKSKHSLSLALSLFHSSKTYLLPSISSNNQVRIFACFWYGTTLIRLTKHTHQ